MTNYGPLAILFAYLGAMFSAFALGIRLGRHCERHDQILREEEEEAEEIEAIEEMLIEEGAHDEYF